MQEPFLTPTHPATLWQPLSVPHFSTPPPPPPGQAVSIIVNAYAKLAVPAPALLHHMADVALAINTGSAPHRAGPGRAGPGRAGPMYTTARRGAVAGYTRDRLAPLSGRRSRLYPAGGGCRVSGIGFPIAAGRQAAEKL